MDVKQLLKDTNHKQLRTKYYEVTEGIVPEKTDEEKRLDRKGWVYSIIFTLSALMIAPSLANLLKIEVFVSFGVALFSLISSLIGVVLFLALLYKLGKSRRSRWSEQRKNVILPGLKMTLGGEEYRITTIEDIEWLISYLMQEQAQTWRPMSIGGIAIVVLSAGGGSFFVELLKEGIALNYIVTGICIIIITITIFWGLSNVVSLFKNKYDKITRLIKDLMDLRIIMEKEEAGKKPSFRQVLTLLFCKHQKEKPRRGGL